METVEHNYIRSCSHLWPTCFLPSTLTHLMHSTLPMWDQHMNSIASPSPDCKSKVTQEEAPRYSVIICFGWKGRQNRMAWSFKDNQLPTTFINTWHPQMNLWPYKSEFSEIHDKHSLAASIPLPALAPCGTSSSTIAKSFKKKFFSLPARTHCAYWHLSAAFLLTHTSQQQWPVVNSEYTLCLW